MKHLLLFFILVSSLRADIGDMNFSSEQIKNFTNGIFEVVIPKEEDDFIVYKEELPRDLLPYRIRNDKYHSIGTAFAIGKNKFVSAAHVFNIHTPTLWTNFFLRDSYGKIYELDQFIKYSQYRDMVLFGLKKHLKDIFIFEIDKKSNIGDIVYTAGNALGEGVAFRKGNITSYTHEEYDGLWRNIRYSAPASPGNSGGPLLNTKGKVIGVVTKKTRNENLNYAIPVMELEKMSLQKSEFYEKGHTEQESGKTLRTTWKFFSKLPASYDDLARISQRSSIDHINDTRSKFVKKYEKELFPYHKNVKTFFRSQTSRYFFGIIDMDGNDRWGVFYQDSKEIQVAAKQKLYFSKNEKMYGSYQILLERPEDVSLEKFIDTPKMFLDTVFKSLDFHRLFAGKKIGVLSYGDPLEKNRWVDTYGRPWFTSIWKTKYNNAGIITNCLVIPAGLACNWTAGRISLIDYLKENFKINIKRTTFSYHGTLNEWSEFLKLSSKYRPFLFKNASVKLKGKSKIHYKFGTFKGIVAIDNSSVKSELYVTTGIIPQKKLKMEITAVSVKPDKSRDGIYTTAFQYVPTKNSVEDYTISWNKLKKRETPYNGKVINRGEYNELYEVRTLGNKRIEKLYYMYCMHESEVSSSDFVKKCKSFRNVSGVKDK